jgi:colanic acid/amylovoran biosynthesis protein
MLFKNGFDVSRVMNFTDPAFLFEPAVPEEIKEIIKNDNIYSKSRKTIGFVLCGFNMLEGPYDKEPRRDDEFTQFCELIEFIINELGAAVFLMSHQNGFQKKPEFKFVNGRDYPYAERLYEIVKKRGIADIEFLTYAKGPYTPKETKAIIRNFDMFISGRIHAFVAAVSQHVPTVIITRGHGGVSHRNIGFAKSVGLEEYICHPESIKDMKLKVRNCWENKEELKDILIKKIPEVKKTANDLFNTLKTIFEK